MSCSTRAVNSALKAAASDGVKGRLIADKLREVVVPLDCRSVRTEGTGGVDRIRHV